MSTTDPTDENKFEDTDENEVEGNCFRVSTDGAAEDEVAGHRLMISDAGDEGENDEVAGHARSR